MRKTLPSFASPDVVRSANMRAIKSRGNRSTENRLRLALVRSATKGWQLNVKDVIGTPDFLFAEKRIVVFVDGCYWHGCPKCGHIPKTNSPYWEAKIGRNKSRDRRYTRQLRAQGYTVIRIWECVLKKHPDQALKRILSALNKTTRKRITSIR
jgi:DNA mismatch endonuclease (patch repair protein)